MDEGTSSRADSAAQADGEADASERSVRDEFVDGLAQVLRAARRAAGQLDPNKLEGLSQKAKEQLGALDRQKLEEIGRRAASQAKNLDPGSLERLAEEAGRELVNVMERLSSRVEKFVDDVQAKVEEPPSSKPTTHQRIRVQSDDDK